MVEPIKVLVVDDDPTVAEIHSRYVMSVEGFSLIGVCSNGKDALAKLASLDLDLVILDIFMPELDGVKTLQKIRRSGKKVDVIVVSAAHEAETFTEVTRGGAFDYILKPFTYERFKAALEAYKTFREKVQHVGCNLNQEAIDSIMARRLEVIMKENLPKGLSPVKLEEIITLLKKHNTFLSADEVAILSGISRVTARRYLEYLVISGEAVMKPHYKEKGRPVNKYKLIR